jgi:hypothetical protein
MTDFDVERLPLHRNGRQKVVNMESSGTAEELEKVCVLALLPLFEKAYADKNAAWKKSWFDPKPLNTPKGGRNYATLGDFITDAINRMDDKLGGGPFVSYGDMLKATEELAQNEEALSLAPGGIKATHVNPVWFTEAAKQFMQGQRFLNKTGTLQGVGVHYVSLKGLYLVRLSKRENRHH